MKDNQTASRGLPVNIQTFAAPAGTEPPAGGESPAQTQTPPANQPATQPIDYSKIQTMLDGTLAAKEDTALKAYFKQQGLSPEEMEQAIAGFKQQKAANQPDVGALQTQLTQAQQAAQQAQLENQATLKALSLGVDIKTVPYLLKLADLSSAVGADGKVSDETLAAAINKVLEDVPALKPQSQENRGFRIGAGSSGQQPAGDDDVLAGIFGIKNKK